ncbi:hypothetical protein [Deinococcus altitudinis]|uniref:hypothetical protein n=1 Tax=Deinococcus altitudinis TaxID=468914 RepID=UPI003892658E
MQKLLTLTALLIAGQWLQPGAEVPLNVPGFDYAKAYRKGMLEAEDGSEVLNPEAETATLPVASNVAEPSSDEASLRTQAAQLTRERDTASQKASDLQTQLNTTKQKASDLQKQLDTANAALKPFEGLDGETLQSQLADLTEYRDVLGELLPASFPARAKLFAGGYYTLPMLEGIEKETLTGVDGIGGTTADQILAALPAPADAPS